MCDTSAVPSNFGWDFQINAGIVLVLDNIDSFSSIRMEGKTEDIEIALTDGAKVYAQAKSVGVPDDYSHVLDNLKKSIKTLSKASLENNCRELILISNTPNPLSNQNEMYQFTGSPLKINYNSLTQKGKNTIDNAVEKLIENEPNEMNKYNKFDKDKFSIQIIPFHSNELPYRYRIIHNKVQAYLSRIHNSLIMHTDDILCIWQSEIFKNGTISDLEIVKTKRDLHLPIVVAELSINTIEDADEMLDLCLDSPDIEEIQLKYNDIINNNVEDYSVFSKIIHDYNNFKKENKTLRRDQYIEEFIKQKWENVSTSLALGDISNFADILKQALVKIILFKLLNNKIRISRILESGE